jgi:hypothetical protein
MGMRHDDPENSENQVGKKRSGESAQLDCLRYIGTDSEQEEEQQRENAEAEGEVFDALEQEAESKVVGRDDVQDVETDEQHCGSESGHPNGAIEHCAWALVRESEHEWLLAGEALEVGHLALHLFASGVGGGADALDAELELVGVGGA